MSTTPYLTLTLAEFDWGFNPKMPEHACFELHTLKFIAGGETRLSFGTRKSYIAKAIAYNAILQG